MKKLIFLCVIMMFAVSLQAQEKNHRFAIKSGYIKYELTGNTTGIKELWWDDYGRKYREFEKSKTVTKILGMKDTQETHKLVVVNNDIIWTVDYVDDEAYKNNFPFADKNPVTGDMTEKEQEELANDILESLGGRRLEPEKVMGYKCDVITLLGTKSWVYKGVMLKITSNILGVKLNSMAVEFKPNKSISSSMFKEPKGVEFENLMSEDSQVEGGLFGAISQAYDQAMEAEKAEAAEDDEYEDEEYEDDDVREIVPVKYPYEKFLKKINSFEYNDYRKILVRQVDGIYSAIFMKGLNNAIAIVASSKQNADMSPSEMGTWFKHKGKKYIYYKSIKEAEGDEDEEVAILMQDVKAYDTYIIITASPVASKEELLKIADKLEF